jgi:hypothetical protein
LPEAFRLRGVAARLFLDDTFQEAGDERDARRLYRLEIARCEQPRPGLVAVVGTAVRQHVGQRRDAG